MGKLTDIQIKRTKSGDRELKLTDGEGLQLVIKPTGKKIWRFRYRLNGKEQTYTIGHYPQISLSEARIKRDEAKMRAQDGKQLTRERKLQKLRNAHAGENSFKAVAERWFDLKRKDLNPKYAAQTEARMRQHVFPDIGDMPIADITIPDVVFVIEKIAHKGTVETAKRMKQTVGQVFRYAAQRGLCEHNPASDLRDILPSQEEKHHALIAMDELPEFLQAIEARPKDMTYYAIKLIMLTFLRTNELIGARWEEIDWQKEEWHIPKSRMKMRRPHMVPLSAQALELLKGLYAMTGEREFIFFSAASKSKHISNGTILMGLRRMGYAGRMTGHGFRALASTILNEKRYNPDAIEIQLAHAPRNKIRAAYNHAEHLLERKKMMQDYADLLDSIANDSESNVIAIAENIRS